MYESIEPSIEYLKKFYPDAIKGDAHIQFLVDNAEFFKTDMETFGTGLENKINDAFEKAKKVLNKDY